MFYHSNPGGTPNKLFSFEFFYKRTFAILVIQFNNILSQLKCFLSLTEVKPSLWIIHFTGFNKRATNVRFRRNSDLIPLAY